MSSQQRRNVLDLHDRGDFSTKDLAAVFRACGTPSAVLLTRAQRDAIRQEIGGRDSRADTVWGVEMMVAPESRVHDGPCDRLLAERNRYRDALENVLAFACAGERLTERQQLRNIYNVAKAELAAHNHA